MRGEPEVDFILNPEDVLWRCSGPLGARTWVGAVIVPYCDQWPLPRGSAAHADSVSLTSGCD